MAAAGHACAPPLEWGSGMCFTWGKGPPWLSLVSQRVDFVTSPSLSMSNPHLDWKLSPTRQGSALELQISLRGCQPGTQGTRCLGFNSRQHHREAEHPSWELDVGLSGSGLHSSPGSGPNLCPRSPALPHPIPSPGSQTGHEPTSPLKCLLVSITHSPLGGISLVRGGPGRPLLGSARGTQGCGHLWQLG